MVNIFLLAGQSNMSGRGSLNEVSPIIHKGILVFNKSGWVPAREPLHSDKPEHAGIGPGMSFALELINRGCFDEVGLLPCAFGESKLSRWMPGATLYENALECVRAAVPERGILRGLLWHQGEGDSCSVEDSESYGRRFREMISGMRSALGIADLPVIAGELGLFLENYESTPFFLTVNDHLRRAGMESKFYRLVSSSGLTDKGDNLHFDSASLRTLGIRYAAVYAEHFFKK